MQRGLVSEEGLEGGAVGGEVILGKGGASGDDGEEAGEGEADEHTGPP